LYSILKYNLISIQMWKEKRSASMNIFVLILMHRVSFAHRGDKINIYLYLNRIK
jgi:hypothetical protein